jgi:hypothetical protein
MLVTFTISGVADQALQLDTYSAVRHSYKRGKGYRVRVEIGIEHARRILAEARDRAASSGGEGWDQPSHWAPACAKAADTIETAIRRCTG